MKSIQSKYADLASLGCECECEEVWWRWRMKQLVVQVKRKEISCQGGMTDQWVGNGNKHEERKKKELKKG